MYPKQQPSIRSPVTYRCKGLVCQENRASAKACSSSNVLPDSTSKTNPVGTAHSALLEEQESISLLCVCSVKGIYNYCFCLSHGD